MESELDFEEDSTSVEAWRDTAAVDYTFFTPPQLPASTHLTTTPLIPPFGQHHTPVVITPPLVHTDTVDPAPPKSAASTSVVELLVVTAPKPTP